MFELKWSLLEKIDRFLIGRLGYNAAMQIEDLLGVLGGVFLGMTFGLLIIYLIVRNTQMVPRPPGKRDDGVVAVRVEHKQLFSIYDNYYRTFPQFMEALFAVTRLKLTKQGKIFIRNTRTQKIFLFVFIVIMVIGSLLAILTSFHVTPPPLNR